MSLRVAQASDQVTRANPPDPSGGFTITAWVRVAVDRDDYSTLARVSSGGSTRATWATDSDGTSGPNYFTVAGTVTNATGLAVGAWRKVALSFAAGTGTVYAQIPGGSTEVDSGAVTTNTPADLLSLGGRGAGDTSEWLNGCLAQVRVFVGALTQAQVEAEWNSPTAVRSAWADWPLVSDLLDASGNGRHLTAGSTSSPFEDDPPNAVTTAALAGAAPRATGTLAGALGDPAAIAGAAPAAVGALAGAVRNLGALAGGAPAALGVLVGDVLDPGAFSGSAPAAVGAMAGRLGVVAELAGAAPRARATLEQAEPVDAVWSAGVPVLAAGWSVGPPVLAGAWSAGAA